MTEKRPFGLPSARLIMIAAVAGIAAGAVAVYVTNVGSGNAGEVASGACEGAVKRVAMVNELSKGEVAAMSGVDRPRPISNLVFKDAAKGEGAPDLTMADFAGKTVLLNLWATWCVPCREEMPALNTLQHEMGAKDFEVVAINIDTGSDQKPKTFLTDTGVDALGFYRDSSMGVFNALKKEGLAFGLPVSLLFDDKGCLIGAMNGPAEWASEDAKKLVSGVKAPI